MSLFSSLSVSASGMAAQRARTEVLVENLANAETTRTPEGGPYRRKDVVFSEDSGAGSFSSALGVGRTGHRDHHRRQRTRATLSARASGCRQRRLRRVSENQPVGGHGGL